MFYQKRAEEVLNLSASKEATRKRESYSKTIDMIYSVPEEEVDREKRREISKTQAQLTGCMLEEQQEYKEYEERQNYKRSIVKACRDVGVAWANNQPKSIVKNIIRSWW